MIQQLKQSKLTFKKILVILLLVPFSIVLLPLMLIVYILLFTISLVSTNAFASKEEYTEEDAIKDFHAEPKD